MKKKTVTLKDYIMAISIFLIALVVGIFIFYSGVQHSIKTNSQEKISINVSRQSEHLRTIFDINYQYLNEIAWQIGKSDSLISQNNIDRLEAIVEKTDLDRAALIEPDGTAHYDNGVEKDLAYRRYFKEAMSGKETLSDPLESSVDQQTRVVLGVPIYNSDNEIIGILGGSCNVTLLSHMLFDDLFYGEGDTLVVKQDGTIIAQEEGDSQQKREISYGGNLLNYYEEKNRNQAQTLNMLKSDFKAGKEGVVQLGLDDTSKSDYYLAYTPLGMNDWMICYIVPVKAAQESYSFIRKYEAVFMLTFCVLVIVLIIYIVHKNSADKAELLRCTQRDALTGLYNKDTTQRLIQNIVQEEAGQHAFIILDIDYFKSINDNFGHIVGDKVLQTFGRFLQSQFREYDVVGRIGGDEFVILMRNLANTDVVEIKIQNLLKLVGSMRVEEMGEQKMTISVGIAFAPQHGSSFMDLYRNADHALYQTKRAGKNGYSLYQREKV